MFKKVCLISVLAAFLIGCSSGIKLQYKGKSGEIRNYQIDTNLDQTMEMMGNEMNFSTQIINLISQKISGVDNDGALNVTFRVDSISFNSTSPQMKMMEDKIKEILDKLKQQEMSYRISSRGEILESAEVDSAISGPLSQVMSTKETFAGMYPEFPAKPVKIGESWNVDKTMPIDRGGMEMKMTMENKYTLVGKEKHETGEFLKISYTGSLQFEGEGEQMGSKLYIEGDGDTKGSFLFDNAAGSYQNGESETNMDLTIAITGGQNMTMPMTQFIKVKISKLK